MVKKFRATLREKVTLFSLVMTAVMVTGMQSFNLIWHGTWTIEVFFTNFPILFVAAFLLNSFVAMPLAKWATALHFELTKK
jgi:hypothetical protein